MDATRSRKGNESLRLRCIACMCDNVKLIEHCGRSGPVSGDPEKASDDSLCYSDVANGSKAV